MSGDFSNPYGNSPDDANFWMSIEVLDSSRSASAWRRDFGDRLIEQAFLDGATGWNWHTHLYGVVLELGFRDEESWLRFRMSLVARHSLGSVPDPRTGLIIYEGRGGPGWSYAPRKPKPRNGAGAATLPFPLPLQSDVFDIYSSAVEQRFLRHVTSNN